MVNFKILIFVLPALFFSSIKPLHAASGPMPDLTIKSVIFEPQALEGEPIGLLKVTFGNIGTLASPQSKIKIECSAVDCDNADDCNKISDALKKTLIVPPLNPGEQKEITWQPPSGIKWVTGNFIISAIIDPENEVKEANENNNINHAAIYLRQFAPERK